MTNELLDSEGLRRVKSCSNAARRRGRRGRRAANLQAAIGLPSPRQSRAIIAAARAFCAGPLAVWASATERIPGSRRVTERRKDALAALNRQQEA